jgi:hypothetical protein
MGGVYAKRIIAAMHHDHSFWYVALEEKIGTAVTVIHQNWSPSDIEPWISLDG